MTTVKQKVDIKGMMGAFFSKLSRGLMLPIAMLPIAGLFLGVGAGIENIINVSTNNTAGFWATFFPHAFSQIGDIIFGNLPTLFCLGVAVAFSEEAGVAVFSAFVGWLVFNATQSQFIWANTHWGIDTDTGKDILITDSYNIFWYVKVPTSVVGSNVGITSMQTSVFGGITIGLFVAFLYNKFHQIELPTVIGFFSGSRFVPIITFLTVPLWGLGFLAVWPLFGIALDWFGGALNAMPIGLNSLIFGIVERSLIPFGLHHAFYSPLWYTSAGGQLLSPDMTSVLAMGDQNVWFEMQTLGIPFNVLNHYVDASAATGTGWEAVNNGDVLNGTSYITVTKDGAAIANITKGMQPGAYMQGKFSFMMFGLPAAGAAMIMAAKKENRQVAMSVIGAAALTSFLTGITEPLEFTFLFLAPVLYYGFHIWMAGISFWLANVLGMHMGMTFSGGIFDWVLFGLIPDATGLHAACYWALIIGVVMAPIYYFVFYFYITKKDIKTPGRDDAPVVMVSKADYKASKGGAAASSDSKAKAGKTDEAWEARADELLVKLGGLDNLKTINACITRLRIDVLDPSIVDYKGIVAMGSKGCVGEGKTSQQHIFGAEADKFKNYFLQLRKNK